MNDTDKPFVMFRRNRFLFNIMPRNASGWLQMGVWLALLVPIVVLFEHSAGDRPQGPELYPALAGFLVVTGIWAVGGIAWMRARAEVIDVEEMLKLKRKDERRRRRDR